MSIDFKTFLSIVPHVIKARYPILTRGRHGIGKSTLVYQIASQMDMSVVERRASQMTEGDLLGLPKVNKGVTQWLAPEWLHTACNTPVILFLDEVDRATMEVRQGIFELCDSRKIAGRELHPDTIIFAAVNGGDHGAQYQVGEMDPAELDRYTVFDVEPTVEDWLTWAKPVVCDEIWNFINQNHQHLEHRTDYEPNKIYPSRRSWERLSKTLAGLNKIEYSPTLYHLATSFVGFEAAIALNDYIKNYDRQITVEDIIDDGRIDLIKDWKINDHNALIEKMKAKETFAEKLTDVRLKNLANYFVRLPSEVAMSLWQAMGTGEFSTHNVSRLHSMTADTGVKIQEYIVEILTAK